MGWWGLRAVQVEIWAWLGGLADWEKLPKEPWGYVLRQNLVMWCLKRFQTPTQAQRSNQEIGRGPKDMMSKPVPQPRPEVWKKRRFDYTVGVVMSSGLFPFSGSHEARCLHN